jgi:hypothetical protein
MNLKMNLKSKKAQALVEYLCIFIIMTVGVFVVFGGLSLGDNLGVSSNFRFVSVLDQAVSNALVELNVSQ